MEFVAQATLGLPSATLTSSQSPMDRWTETLRHLIVTAATSSPASALGEPSTSPSLVSVEIVEVVEGVDIHYIVTGKTVPFKVLVHTDTADTATATDTPYGVALKFTQLPC